MRRVDVPVYERFPYGTPTRENCDPAVPEHAYLPALIQLPYRMFPLAYLMMVSNRLFDLFGPPNPDWVPVKVSAPCKSLPTFPTREVCDSADPQQAYLWGLVGLPFQKGAPLLFGMEDLMVWSETLWGVFGPPNPDWAPRLVYRLPQVTDADALTSAGKWVAA